MNTVLKIPPPKPDQRAYLERIHEHQKQSADRVQRCTCLFGGSGYDKSRSTCPVHGTFFWRFVGLGSLLLERPRLSYLCLSTVFACVGGASWWAREYYLDTSFYAGVILAAWGFFALNVYTFENRVTRWCRLLFQSFI